MNKTEAIKVLKKELQIIDDPNVTMTAREWEEHDDQMRDALDMAIEALEQEETLQNLTKPNKSDLISRQAAIDAVNKNRDSVFHDSVHYEDAVYDISNLPSAQPFTKKQIQTMQELESAQLEKAYELGKADRPKGEWKKTEHSTNENGFKKWIEIRCPFCGHEPVYENIDDMEFCPKCGANMTGGEKE